MPKAGIILRGFDSPDSNVYRVFLLTCVGLWGSFPSTPPILEDVLKSFLARWILTGIILYDSFEEHSSKKVIATLVAFAVLHNVLWYISPKKTTKK